MKIPDLSSCDFAPVIAYSGEWYLFDLSETYDREFIRSKKWGIGKYNEKRREMYTAPQYEGRRNIHMGIDLWTPAGEPVHAFYDGEIAYMADNDQPGNYGPTVVTRHRIAGYTLYALHGHLTKESLDQLSIGYKFKKGEAIAAIGTEEENGGWIPHLHFQISFQDPGIADMPGVVAEEEHQEALRRYPDPRIVLGNLY